MDSINSKEKNSKEDKNLIKYNDFYPKVDKSVFLGHGARVIGDVTIGENSSIWYNCVLRGDVDSIKIGKNTNVQDGSVIHSSRFNGKTIIGNNVTVGHAALIHACKIMDNGFVGMHSTIMDNVVIEEYGFVGAGALISPNKIVKSRQLWAGVPAKYIRDITEDEFFLIKDSWEHYVKLAHNHIKSQI